MIKNEILMKVNKGVIVSCQALKDEPLHSPDIMARLALAAQMSGAVGIRANSPIDIKAIKKLVDLPIIGLHKVVYEDSPAYITPTINEVQAIIEAGADIVAMDCTKSLKPGGISTRDFISEVKKKFNALILADISTYEEAIEAQSAGADFISTTLSGYTPYSPQIEGPDLDLVERLVKDVEIPVFAEGRIWTPEEAIKALELGAYAVIIGSAITRPQEITKRFVKAVASISDGGK